MQATHAEYLSVSHQLVERTVDEKRKLNQQAPISRLHPEIFSNIFSLVRDYHTGTFRSPLYPLLKSRRHWIGLTHVCYVWRDIAINSSTLWAKIFVSVEDQLECQWVREILCRSKQCALSVLICKPSLGALSASDSVCLGLNPMHRLKGQMHRFFQLGLLNFPNVDLHDFFSNSRCRQLKHLHISMQETSPSDGSESLGAFTLNDNILCVDSLQHLRLVHCGIDFHASFLHTLTHLELFDIDEDCRLPCSDFVAVLADLPALEVLSLEGFLGEGEADRDDVEEYVATRNKTRLHHIKYLNLSCHVVGEMAQFLCSLMLPPSCKLRLGISDQDVAIAPGFRLLTSWLTKHFQPPPSPVHEGEEIQTYFRGFQIEESVDNDELVVTGFCESSHMSDFDKALLSISVLWSFESGSTDDFWLLFLRSLPLSNIVSLEVMDDSMTLPDAVWVEVFAPIRTLKTVIIDTNYYLPFFDAASANSRNSMGVPFPALSSVIVKAPCIKYCLAIAISLDLRMEAGLAPLGLVFYTDEIPPLAIIRLSKSALNVKIHPY